MSREALQRIDRQVDRLTTPREMAERIDLLREALAITKHEPDRWGEYNVLLAESYLENARGDAMTNIELALAALLEGLQVVDEEEYRKLHAKHQHLLAHVYLKRLHGDRSANIEAAIAAAQKATYLRRTDKAKHVAGYSLRVLGEAYLQRLVGNRDENIEEAITIFEEVRQLLPVDVTPEEWATTSLMLVEAYRQRTKCDRHVNAGMAIGILQNVLPHFPKHKSPIEWAKVQWLLGKLYYDQFVLGSTANLEQAILYLNQAATVFTAYSFPIEYARLQYELGQFYLIRVQDTFAQNLDWAIGLFVEAAKYFVPTKTPAEWVEAHLSAARAYRWRLEGDANENLELAAKSCQAVLEVCAQHQMHAERGEALYLLAEVNAESTQGDVAQRRESALHHLEQVLKTVDRVSHATLWAKVLVLRGRLLLVRQRGVKANNIEHALKSFSTAIEVATLDTLPFTWAAAQHGLGQSYAMRQQGDEANNAERAIAAFGQALQVRTFDDYPRLWAATMHALARALMKRKRGRGDDHLNRAIKSHQDAFTVNWQHVLHEEWLQQRVHMALLIEQRRQQNPHGDSGESEKAWHEIHDFMAAQFPTHDDPAYVGRVWAVARRRIHFRRLVNDHNGAIHIFERTAAMLPRRDLVLANSVPAKLTEEQQQSFWTALDQWRLLSAWSRKFLHATTLQEMNFANLYPLRENMQAAYRTLRDLGANDPDFNLRTLGYSSIGELARARDVTLVYLMVGHDPDWGTDALIVHPNSPAERLAADDVLSFPSLTAPVVHDLLYAGLDHVHKPPSDATPPELGWLAAHARWCAVRDADARRLWRTTVRRQLARLGQAVATPLARTLNELQAREVVLLCDPWLAFWPWHAMPCDEGRNLGEWFDIRYAPSATIFAKKGSGNV